MDKVRVKICAGTACFVMGAPQVQTLEFAAPEDLADKIEVVEVRCMNHCSQGKGYNKGPFVEVDNELIEEATFDKVVAKIREVIAKKEEKQC
jgi:NADH:ubiquinone oxidoreductase subunit E